MRYQTFAGRTGLRLSASMIPIVGPRTPTHLDAYLQSLDLDLDLDEEYYQRLHEVSAVRVGTPYDAVAAALSGGFDGDRSLLDTRVLAI